MLNKNKQTTKIAILLALFVTLTGCAATEESSSGSSSSSSSGSGSGEDNSSGRGADNSSGSESSLPVLKVSV